MTVTPTPDGVDTGLMIQAARGDLAAFEQLVRRNQSFAWSLAWRSLADSAEAQDVVQEAFLKIYRAASRYKPTARFRTYLSRVVTRLCLDRLAKKGPDYTDELPDMPEPSPDPEALAIGSELRDAVQGCLSRLPPNQRLAVMLRQYEGLSYDEIAEALDVTPKAVDSLLQRAREALRACLSAQRS